MLTRLLALIERLTPSHAIPFTPEPVRRILLVDLNFLGDMLMSSPVYRALKEHFPQCKIDALSYGIVEPVLRANPYIDALYRVENTKRHLPLALVPALRRNRYDLVLQLNTSLLTNVLMWLIGGKDRLGYNYAHRGCLNTIRVPIPTRTTRVGNRVDECIGLIEKAFGWTIADRRMVLEIPASASEQVGRIMRDEGLSNAPLLIAIHTNCRQGKDQRRWGGAHFAALAERLSVQLGCTVLFTGGRDDQAYVQSIVQRMTDPQHVRNLAGRLSLIETAALLKRVHLFVTINTGPMHLAVALDVPTVAIIGGTPASVVCPRDNPRFRFLEDPALAAWDPRSPWLRSPAAITSITVDAVFDSVLHLLQDLGRLRQNPPVSA